jgi:hypothetical protein
MNYVILSRRRKFAERLGEILRISVRPGGDMEFGEKH